MQSSGFHRLVVAVFVCVGASIAQGQTGLSRTKTVDASGNGDYTTIGAALAAIVALSTTDKWTVLVYPGIYHEHVVIDRAHTDLVGVDRDNVIIERGKETNPDGIRIKGNTDLDMTIRNLTIKTDDDDFNEGRGIVIEKTSGGTSPSNITLDSLNIITLDRYSDAIHTLDPCSGVRVTNCIIRAHSHTSRAIAGDPITGLKVIDCDILMRRRIVCLGQCTGLGNHRDRGQELWRWHWDSR